MAFPLHACAAALVGLAFWFAVGWPLARRVVGPALAAPFAAVIGWAAHGALAVPLFLAVPFTTTNVALFGVASLVASWTVAHVARRRVERQRPTGAPPRIDRDVGYAIPRAAWLAAAVVAAVVAAAVVPKSVGDAVRLANPIFDHAKVAIVDDIARLGLPPGNPFIANDGGPERLSYYYLLHLSAAELVRVVDVDGWEADAAMTFVAAYTSLIAMMALAARWTGRSRAAWWVLPLAVSASARVVLLTLFGNDAVDAWVKPPGGLQGWLFQSSWVPQHLMSTSCVLAAVAMIHRLARRPEPLTAATLALVVAAAFESSTWIGGVVFACACAAIVPLAIAATRPGRRVAPIVALVGAGAAALALAWPFVVDQLAASGSRQHGSPIAVQLFDVVGPAVPGGLRALLDVPAFWLVLLPIEWVALVVPGFATALRSLMRSGRAAGTARTRGERRLFAATCVAGFAIAWLLRSTLADNNDLAWRAALLATTILIPFAATGLARWIAARRWPWVVVSLVAIALGAPEAIHRIEHDVAGVDRPEARTFAAAPALWSAVRRQTGPTERVASNPNALAGMTPWPVNIGWALLADRRSCYAGWELTQVYSSMPHDRLRAVDAQFVRVFDGRASSADIDALAGVRDCAVAVVTPDDGAWTRDPFRASGRYALVDDTPRWRIYRRTP